MRKDTCENELLENLMADLYFTSDNHFGHQNIIRYCERPFASLEEMNETMIERWNQRVKHDDIVYHIGDFALRLGVPEVEAIVRRLNGEKHLVLGNHDLKNKSVLRARGFVEKVDYKELKVGEQKIILCHYPFLTWNKSHHGSWDLHGHCHGTLQNPTCPFCLKSKKERTARRLDVGVDCWNYAPISFDEVKKEMEKVEFKPIDHHGSEEKDL